MISTGSESIGGGSSGLAANEINAHSQDRTRAPIADMA